MTINLYHPKFWKEHGHWDYQNMTMGGRGIWENALYKINPSSFCEADFIVVHQDIESSMKLKGRNGGFILVTGEEKSVHSYYHQEFLNQFDLIITSRDDINHHNVLRLHYLHPWRVKKTFEELNAYTEIKKSKTLSAIISNLTTLPLQRERYSFAGKLKEYYGDDLQWYSKGQATFLKDKWNGLEPFRYSIAIENSQFINYFTEKISDCFLAFTMPIYQGCINISDFFDERSYIQIDIKNLSESISKIDEAINENLYERNLLYIKESRKLVLEKYHFIAALTGILNNLSIGAGKTQKIIRPQIYFDKVRNKKNSFSNSLKWISKKFNK